MTREEAISGLKEIRDWAGLPYCIEEPLGKEGVGVITTEMIDMAIKALEQEPCEDCISRQAVLNTLFYKSDNNCEVVLNKELQDRIKALPHVTPTHKEWIPVSERLPEDLEAVNITWVNHEPEPYYHDIKDRNFTATGIHYRGKWYWYSTTCADYLGEYGSNEVDEVDSAIEIVAWMPLPEPYNTESEG